VHCEHCQQHEATIHLTQMIDGQSRELHLCEDCAEASGLNVQGVMSIPEILFGMGTPGEADSGEGKSSGKSCPQCHMRGCDFKKTGRLGCPSCYETFSAELGPMLAAMHKGGRHTGKVPESRCQGLEKEARLAQFQKQLQEAIRTEHYEEAARLRDQIREAGHDPQ
jgi:protein arginine kinase activator